MKEHNLSKAQISLLVSAYNSSYDSDMTLSEFEQDDVDLVFWGHAIFSLVTSLFASEYNDNRAVIGRKNISSTELRSQLWSIAILMSNDLAVADELDGGPTGSFKRITDDDTVPMPEKSYEVDNKLFAFADYCRKRAY